MTEDWLLRCAEHGYETGMETRYAPRRLSSSSSAITAAAERVETAPGHAATRAHTIIMPSAENLSPRQLSAGVSGAGRAALSGGRSGSSGVAGACVGTGREIEEALVCGRPAVPTTATATARKHQVGTSTGRSPRVTKQASPCLLPRPQNGGLSGSAEGRPTPNYDGGGSRAVARDLFSAGRKAEVREEQDSSFRPRGDSEGERKEATPVAVRDRREKEGAAMAAVRAAATAAATAEYIPAVDASSKPSPPPPPLAPSVATGASASGPPEPARASLQPASTATSPSAPPVPATDNAFVTTASGRAGTSSGLEQQLLSMLSGGRRRSSGATTGVGVNARSVTGGAAGGIQRLLPRERRPRLIRPASIRPGLSLSAGALTPASGSTKTFSDAGTASGSPCRDHVSSLASRAGTAAKDAMTGTVRRVAKSPPGDDPLFSATGSGGGGVKDDEHCGSESDTDDRAGRSHEGEQGAEGVPASDGCKASPQAPPQAGAGHLRLDCRTGKNDHEDSGPEDEGLVDSRGQARPLLDFDSPRPRASSKRKTRDGGDSGSGLRDSAPVGQGNRRDTGGGISKRPRGGRERGSTSGGIERGGERGGLAPLPIGQENEQQGQQGQQQQQQQQRASTSKQRTVGVVGNSAG